MEQLSKSDFEQKLSEFFTRHDVERKRLAPIIASKFHEHQSTVFKHLTEIYTEGNTQRTITDESILSFPRSANSGSQPY